MFWPILREELNRYYQKMLAYGEKNKDYFADGFLDKKDFIKEIPFSQVEQEVKAYEESKNPFKLLWLRLMSDIKKKQALLYYLQAKKLVMPWLDSREAPKPEKLNELKTLFIRFRNGISFFSSLKNVLQSLLTFFSQPGTLFSEAKTSPSVEIYLLHSPKRKNEAPLSANNRFNPRASATEEEIKPSFSADLSTNVLMVASPSQIGSSQGSITPPEPAQDYKIDAESLKAQIKAFSRAQIKKLCGLNVKLTQTELDFFCKECFSELSKLKHEVAFLHPDRNQEIDDDLSRALFDEIYSLFQEEKSMLLLLIENEQVMVTLFDLMDKQKQQSETFYKEMSQMRVEEGKKRDELFETYVAKFEKLRQEHKSDAEEMKKQRAADAEEMKKQREADQNELNRKLDGLESKLALLMENDSDSEEVSLNAGSMPESVSAEEDDKKPLLNPSSYWKGSAKDQISEDQNKPKM